MRFLFPFILIFTFAGIASADCTGPIGKRGQFQINASLLQLCNGTAWVSIATTSDATSCSPNLIWWESPNMKVCLGGITHSFGGTNDGTSCSTSGQIQFDDSSGTLKLCRGNWYTVSPAPGNPCEQLSEPTIGANCGGGSVYAGKDAVNRYIVYLPSTSYYFSGVNFGSNVAASYSDAVSNTTGIAANDGTGTSSGVGATGAKYCRALTIDSKTWHMAARDDFDVLNTNKALLPGLSQGQFDSYWASTMTANNSATTFSFYSGVGANQTYFNVKKLVVCIRKITIP